MIKWNSINLQPSYSSVSYLSMTYTNSSVMVESNNDNFFLLKRDVNATNFNNKI